MVVDDLGNIFHIDYEDVDYQEALKEQIMKKHLNHLFRMILMNEKENQVKQMKIEDFQL
jgi:hypothetical protein